MKITHIKPQVKRPNRYSVYIDGKYSFALSEAGLIDLKLQVGQELSAKALHGLKDQATYDKARSQALDQLSRRPRSQWELQQYLQRRQYDEEVIDQTITYLSERGYLNDVEFAQRWVENRRLLKPTSRRRLRQELQQKRVSAANINLALASDETDEQQVLKSLIEKKRQQAKYQDDLKLMQFLARQGFSYGDIRTVLDELSSSRWSRGYGTPSWFNNFLNDDLFIGYFNNISAINAELPGAEAF